MHDPPLVLVVDDTANVRELIRVNLTLEGFVVRMASDGQEALDLVSELLPDLITMDVVMPRVDGLTAVIRLKTNPATASIPIVMVTARAQTADRDRARKAGVDAYLTKPFEPSELIETVRNLLDDRR